MSKPTRITHLIAGKPWSGEAGRSRRDREQRLGELGDHLLAERSQPPGRTRGTTGQNS